jgi:ABC-2 type transport system ATP-binding protein
MSGGIEDVVRAYEGDEAGDHVAHVIQELEREKSAASANGTV